MLKRKLLLAFVLLCPVYVYAFGLGDIEVRSFLNQPLDARIELINAKAVDDQRFQVKIAGPEVFSKAGLDRPFLLSQLKFRPVVGADGRPFIQVSSRRSIKEPYLDFFIEVKWLNRVIIREYTLLLDLSPAIAPAVAEQPRRPSGVKPVTAGKRVYGPVKQYETLGAIAKRLVPHKGISLEQMMIALLRENPQAFNRQNVNLLRRGSTLVIPERDVIEAIDPAAARSEFERQLREWKALVSRTTAPSAPPALQDRAEAMVDAKAGPPVIAREATDTQVESPRLRILAPEALWAEKAPLAPVTPSDRLKAAIADSALDLVAVRDINADLASLRTALEAKIEALRESLLEKEQAIADLKRQLQRVRGGEQGAGSAMEAGTPRPPGATAPLSAQSERMAGAGRASPGAPVRLVMEGSGVLPKMLPDDGYDIFSLRVLLPLLGGVVVAGIGWLLWLRRKVDTGESVIDPAGEDTEAQAGVDEEEINLDEFLSDLLANKASQDEEHNAVGDSLPEAMEGDVASILAEADIYLAYRRYSQAESLIKKALGDHPLNLELKSKLLELYFHTKDTAAFTDLFSELQDQLATDHQELHDRVVSMARELVPDHPLMRGEDAIASRDGRLIDMPLVDEIDLILADEENPDIDPDIDVNTLSLPDDWVVSQPAPSSAQENERPDVDMDAGFESYVKREEGKG